MKEIRKQKKKKRRKEKKNMKMDPGETVRPRIESSPRPTFLPQTGTPLLSLSLTDRWDPPIITHLRPKSTPEIDLKLPPLTPIDFVRFQTVNRATSPPYKSPLPPLLFPPLSPLYYAARQTKSIVGVRHCRRRVFFDAAVIVRYRRSLLVHAFHQALAHLLMSPVPLNSQQIDELKLPPKLVVDQSPPATPLHRVRR
jgi:hypothetical protein